MKRFLTFCFTLFISAILFGQSDVVIKIDHRLAGEKFDWGKEATNDLGHKFNVDRLEYYLAEIGVIHDGGQETMIADLYVLVNPSNTTEINLGELSFTTLEGIFFSVGVDESMNHRDPSALHPTHPLAPQNPSMHWGWNAGYRFVALEGNSGQSLNVGYQFHGLGDSNYARTTLMMAATEENGLQVMNVMADYTKAMQTIDLNAGPISHGETGPARTCVQNFNNYVFAPSDGTSSIEDLEDAAMVTVYPNPSMDGAINIEADQLIEELTIIDLTGKLIATKNVAAYHTSIELDEAGVYILNMRTDSGSIVTQKVTVEKY